MTINNSDPRQWLLQAIARKDKTAVGRGGQLYHLAHLYMGSICMGLVNNIIPHVFRQLSKYERYRAALEVNVTLGRYWQWGTYSTNNPGGAVTRLRLRAVNRQRHVTSLRRIHSLYPAFVNTRCSYAL